MARLLVLIIRSTVCQGWTTYDLLMVHPTDAAYQHCMWALAIPRSDTACVNELIRLSSQNWRL